MPRKNKYFRLDALSVALYIYIYTAATSARRFNQFFESPLNAASVVFDTISYTACYARYIRGIILLLNIPCRFFSVFFNNSLALNTLIVLLCVRATQSHVNTRSTDRLRQSRACCMFNLFAESNYAFARARMIIIAESGNFLY